MTEPLKPTDLTARAHPAPANWPTFESLTLDVFKVIWKNPHAQKNGRQGDLQKGVDIFGVPKDEKKMAGVQCKGKVSYLSKDVTFAEFKDELEKAEKFEPKLGSFSFVTSGMVSSAVLEKVNKLSEVRVSKGKFPVYIKGWDWFLNTLGDAEHIQTAAKYGYILPGTEPSSEPRNVLKDISNAQLEAGAVQAVNNATDGSTINQTINISQSVPQTEIDLSSQVDYAKKLIDEGKPGEAIDYIASIEAKVMKSSAEHEKYRLITNKGSAYLRLKETDKAAKYFKEAFPYRQKDEAKALSNLALAHLLLGDKAGVLEYADQAIALNPNSPRAYAYKIQALKDEKTLLELVEIIPDDMRHEANIALALGFIAELHDEMDAAKYWLEIAHNADPNDAEICSTYAMVLLKPLANMSGFLGQLSDEDKDTLNKVIEMLDMAISRSADDKSRKTDATNLYNRGAAKRLLGNIEEAIKDTERAVEYEPDNAHFSRHLAKLYAENGEKQKAISILSELADRQDMSEIKIALAEMFMEINDPKQAVKILQEFIEKESSNEFVHSAYFVLLGILIDTNNIEEAQKVVEVCSKEESNSSFSLILSGILKRHQGDSVEAAEVFIEAKKKLAKDAPVEEVSILADELYKVELFKDAVELYERFIDKKVASGMSRTLLNAYYRAGDYDSALKLLRVIQKAQGISRYIVQMASNIYEDIGDIDKAQKVCEEYIKNNPNDTSIKLRLAVMLYRKGEVKQLNKLLDQELSTDDLSLQNMILLSQLSLEAGRSVEYAIKVAYEARHKYFKDVQAHMNYVGLLFGRAREKSSGLLEASKIVAPDSVVFVKNSRDEQRHFVIEERPEKELAKDEILVTSEVGKLLIGKKVGDQISFGREDDWEISEIKSKYLHALHESTNNFATMFPGDKSLQRFTFDDADAEDSLKQVLENVDAQHTRVRQAISSYKQGVVTIGMLAKMLGSGELDTIYGLMSEPDNGIIMASTGVSNLSESLKALEGKPRIVVDLSGIISITNLKITKQIIENFGKPFVAPSVLDDLQQELSSIKDSTDSGYGTIAKRGKNYIRDEVTPDRVQKRADYIQGLINWVKDHAEVSPVRSALKMDATERHKAEEVIGKASLDSALLAQGKNRVFFTDDERLRMIAKVEFKVDGVWSQAVLTKLHDQGAITLDSYHAGIVRLAAAHYRHTSIAGDTLISAAKEAKWTPGSPFTDVVSEVTRRDITEESLVYVATGFLQQLWRQPLTFTQRQFLTQYIVAEMKRRTVYNPDILDKLASYIRSAFRLNPTAAAEIIEIIQAIRDAK